MWGLGQNVRSQTKYQESGGGQKVLVVYGLSCSNSSNSSNISNNINSTSSSDSSSSSKLEQTWGKM